MLSEMIVYAGKAHSKCVFNAIVTQQGRIPFGEAHSKQFRTSRRFRSQRTFSGYCSAMARISGRFFF